MLRNLSLDLDLSKVGRDVKLQLALPNKTIKKNISNVTQANLDGVEINGLPTLTFEIPHKIQKRVGTTDEMETIDNPDIKMVKEKMLIKLTWYNKERENWFRVTSITQTDSQEFVSMKVEADALASELRATSVTVGEDPTTVEEYFKYVLSQTAWKLGSISDKLKDTYRSFDDNKKTRYEAVQDGLETFGAIAEWNEEDRILNLLSISDIREYRGVVLKKENYVSSLEINSDSEDIVTRLYVYGSEGLGIEKVNPTGMAYIEDFSYFIFPFERDENKNVLSHSDYMSDELCHAILDLIELQKEYNPRIKDLQNLLNSAYSDLSKAMMEKVELDGELVSLEALLDTAKATNDLPLVAQREKEVQAKEIEIFEKAEEIKNIQDSIKTWEDTILSYQELISTTSFTEALQVELSLFIYEQEFTDDRYIDEKELYEAGKEQFEKYQQPIRSFNIELASFVNSLESQHLKGRLGVGEEVLVKSTKLNTQYKSIVLGYNVDFKTGDYNLIISDNMDDINSLDKLATLIYNADSSSTILNNNKYKWDNVTSIKDEVEMWRDKEIQAVDNRIVAGANESIVIDNRGIQAHNPDFPNEKIIIQSGVVALSRNGGKTWSTSITPYGVIAETIIGKIIAGNNLIITNDNGSFVIDSSGLTINMEDIHIMSGESGSKEDMIQLWNNLLLTYEEIATDNLVNEYEKNQLEKQWTKITNIHSSMLKTFEKGWKPLEETETEIPIKKPIEYNEYIKAYEDLNKYLNATKQTDGFALLDKDNRNKTTEIDPVVFQEKFKEYETKKQAFESIISMSFTKASIDIMEEGISLNYTRNKEIVTQLNLSEEGIKIDGKLLEINADTVFKKDLIMDSGVIKDKDDGIIIDLNKGEITLNKPIKIGVGSNLVSKEDLENIALDAYTFVLSNDSATVPTDKNGMNGDYSTAKTTPTVYKGTKDDTENWEIETTPTVGLTGSMGKKEYSVTNLTKDSGTVTFYAKPKEGKGTLVKSFQVSKSKAGNDGEQGKSRLLTLTADSYIMTFTNDLPKPDEQTVSIKADLIGSEKAISWEVVPYLNGQSLMPIPKIAENNTIKITEKDLTGNIDLVKVIAISDDLVDTLSIVKVKNGDGIKSTRVEYQIGVSGTEKPTGVWSVIIPEPVKGSYLWIRTTTTYTNDSKVETFSVSYYPKDGQTGSQGNGIEKTVIEYQSSSSGTTTPTGSWISTVPSVPKGSYLWTRTTITYTDKTTSVSYSTSYSPKDGEKGDSTITGLLTNESITLNADVNGNVSNYTTANGIFDVYDGLTKKTGSAVKYSVIAKDSIDVTIDANGKYVASGFVTGKDKVVASATLQAVYGGVTITKVVTFSKALTGAGGATGASATSYWITASNNIIGKSQTGVINPTTITFKGFSKTGTANSVAYSGRFIIQTSTNGTAYTTRYTSSANQSSYTYTIPADSLFVKCLFYMANGTTVLLDEQTVPIVESAEGIEVGGRNLYIVANSEKGYMNSSEGATTTAAPYGERTSEYINISNAKNITISYVMYPTPDYKWYAYSFYDADKVIIGGRPAWHLVGSENSTTTEVRTLNVPDNVVYIRVSARWLENGQCKLQVEKGTVATDWTPAPEDMKQYKAWANSEDGKDFTKIAKRDNLLENKPEQVYQREGVTNGEFLNSVDWNLSTILETYGLDKTYTMSFDIKTTLGGSVYVYVQSGNGTKYGMTPVETFKIMTEKSWVRHSITSKFSLKDSKQPNALFAFFGTYGTKVYPNVKNFKIEIGTEPTPYAIDPLKYVGFSPQDSDNPSDYEWIISPEYTQMVTDLGLLEKANQEDLESVEETANNANNLAENAVQQKEFYSWLEQDYENQIADLNNLHDENRQDLLGMNDRATALEANWDNMKVKWNFIDNSFTFSNEGMFISNNESKMAIQISSNKIVFWDNNVDVASITGEVLEIKRGIFLDSATIGNHVITKYSNASPVTIIRYVGNL